MTIAHENHPPPLTGGWKPSVSVKIDWISGTFKRGTTVSYPDGLNADRVETKPMNAYNAGVRYKDGRLELWHTSRPEMGTHFIWSGETLRNMLIDPLEALKHVVEHGASITRLDLAVDCVNCNLRPSEATEHIKSGEVKTRAKQYPTWTDPKNGGYTQYIGKKSSEIYCRIYDKAAEMGISGDYTRVECSYGGERAKVAAKQVCGGSRVQGLIRGYVDFPQWDEWKVVMDAPTEKVRAEKKLSNRRAWLLSQVAPALAVELELDGDDEFWFDFIDAVRLKREEIRSRVIDVA